MTWKAFKNDSTHSLDTWTLTEIKTTQFYLKACRNVCKGVANMHSKLSCIKLEGVLTPLVTSSKHITYKCF